MKSGRPTGFLDASEAFRVYHSGRWTLTGGGRVGRVRPPPPWKLGGLRLDELVLRVCKKTGDDELFDRAAGLSYYFLFALFPTLLFLTALLGLLPIGGLADELIAYARRVLPADAASLLMRTVEERWWRERAAASSPSAFLPRSGGPRPGMASIIRALNVACNCRQEARVLARDSGVPPVSDHHRREAGRG